MPERKTLDFAKITSAAIRTAKWATTMTKWRIGFETRGRRLGKAGVNTARCWQQVGLPGPAGRESAGIVDLIAIRKDHSAVNGNFNRGDLFEIILIQIKGGGARWPNADDICRLRAVAKRYRARDVVLAAWVKGSHQKFYTLNKKGADPKTAWKEVDSGIIFS
ncbi:MAG: hypothetical protein WD688_10145 [Candidatus Binatia bacterium]